MKNLISNGKVMIIYLIVGLTKKTLLKKKLVFFLPFGLSKNKIQVELDLPNYATKSDLKTQQVLIHRNLLTKMI